MGILISKKSLFLSIRSNNDTLSDANKNLNNDANKNDYNDKSK